MTYQKYQNDYHKYQSKRIFIFPSDIFLFLFGRIVWRMNIAAKSIPSISYLWHDVINMERIQTWLLFGQNLEKRVLIFKKAMCIGIEYYFLIAMISLALVQTKLNQFIFKTSNYNEMTVSVF